MNTKDIKFDTKVKVIFGKHDTRFPMIGKFVQLYDSAELQKKGMVRFVNQSRLEYFENTPNVGLTRIYSTVDFAQIRDVG